MKKDFLFLFLIFFLAACDFNKLENLPYVKTEIVKAEFIPAYKTYHGYISDGLDVDLSFNVSGIIKDRYYKEGDYVKKGALLATLDSDEYKFIVEKANAELNDAYVKKERIQSYYDRISKLYNAGGISYNDWEEAKTNLKSSFNQIEILKDALKIAKKQENFTKIYAPYDGYIIKAYKEPYQFVNSGEPVFYFQGQDDFEARIFVPQGDINNIKENETVEIIADIYPDKKYKGIIKSKINSSLNKGSYEVKILFSDKTPELLDGMSVNVNIGDFALTKEIYIPVSSIINENNKTFVYILNKENNETGTVLKKEIKTGSVIKDKIKVQEGISVGDIVVIDGVINVMEGARVNYL